MQYETSQLYVVDVATGAIRELVAKPGDVGHGRSCRPTAARSRSPATRRRDTRTRSAICSSSRSPAAASDMRKISGDFDRDPINLRWAPDGTGLYFDADDRGARNVQFASIVGRRQAGDQRPAHAVVRLGVEGSGRRRHLVRPRSPAGRRQVQPEAAGPGHEAHRRQRRRAAGQAAREDRGESPTPRPATRR